MMPRKGRDGCHELEKKNCSELFICHGCQEEGLESRYSCLHCDYKLHEECKSPKRTISHYLFPGCTFYFHRRPPSRLRCGSCPCKDQGRYCVACGTDVHGYVYRCPDKDVYLHPCCTNLGTKLCIGGTRFDLRDRASPSCLFCTKEKGGCVRGWTYVSECEKYHLHVNCVKKEVQEAWKGRGEDDDACCKALEKRVDLKELARRSNRSRIWGKTLWKIAEIVLEVILGIILGEPFSLIYAISSAVKLIEPARH